VVQYRNFELLACERARWKVLMEELMVINAGPPNLVKVGKFDGVLVYKMLERQKSDALVGRVNTFFILHTKEFKIAFKIRNL
jgi:hypothetical protein